MWCLPHLPIRATISAYYWRRWENPLDLSQGMKGQHLLSLCTQVGFSKRKRFYSARDPLS